MGDLALAPAGPADPTVIPKPVPTNVTKKLTLAQR
jgi:hypothetical protein